MAPMMSSTMTMKRIHREIADLKKEDLGPMILAPLDDNLFVWRGSIPGPQGSVYEGGIFNLEVNLPNDYPFSAPKVMFKTRIYHMNISEMGNICIDILKQNWSPALSLFKVMLSLSSLLTDPNPKDPLVPSIATQYTRNRKLHDSTARQWTELYAPPPKPETPAPSISALPLLSKPTRGKGKARAVAEPSISSTSHNTDASGSSSSKETRGKTQSAVIVIDSDNEDSQLPAASPKGKRKRGAAPVEVLDLLDESDDEQGTSSSTGTLTRNTRKRARNSDTSTALPLRQLGDVIIIEDD